MSQTVVMVDGGVSGLLACAAAGQAIALGPAGNRGFAFLTAMSGARERAGRRHADLFGLEGLPVQIPSAVGSADAFETTCAQLLGAALAARRLAGGDVVWPVSSLQTGAGDEPGVARVAAAMNQALLVSQLVSVTDPTTGSLEVRVRTPYADLTDRQIADLVLDMDLPVWTCWWMDESELGQGDSREEAKAEREKWTALLKSAGWVGSLEAKAKVTVRPIRRPSANEPGNR